jgi:hypothetical protein
LPGFFGFAVWELKENWRLYLANRKDRLRPVPVGSHGETIVRLLRPGFHSGTLPKIFRKLRRLENKDASLGRFTSRRSTREQLHHVEQAIQAFVDRELISLLQKCEVWKSAPVRCTHVEAASNSFSVELECPSLGDLTLRFCLQEQSGWLIVSLSQLGWFKGVSKEQENSFLNALEGFYRKCGIDLVRQQVESNFTKNHAYDVDTQGLVVWPTTQFDVEIVANLEQEGVINPQPAFQAAEAGIAPIEREKLVFSATHSDWKEWERIWSDKSLATSSMNRIGFPAASTKADGSS